jgi:hypothetical protein
MAIYKVPQDVEADDKILGPFSFRQFVYLVIVALAILIAYGLGRLSLFLVIIPLPIVVFFGALALPLRKDQPMEIYMAALLSFYLKPRKRFWDPDGIDSLIEITAPRIIEPQRTKDISQNEAERRLGYLAEVVDSRGWAVRGAGAQTPNSAMNSDVYFESQQIQDVLDDNSVITHALNNKLDQNTARIHKDMVDIANGKKLSPSEPLPSTSTSTSFDYFGGSSLNLNKAPDPVYNQHIEYNPYPEEMQQTVIQPIESTIKPSPTTSGNLSSADIMNLVSDKDSSIETIAHKANRIREKQNSGEEVFISLR